MGSLMAHDCCYLILGFEELQQAGVEYHLPSRSNKSIHVVRLIDDCKLPLQVLRSGAKCCSSTLMQESAHLLSLASHNRQHIGDKACRTVYIKGNRIT